MARILRERRLADKIFVTKNGCFVWNACLGSSGYGSVRLNGKLCSVHRIAWELEFGPIPEGFCVLHKCDNRQCVNPNHLFLGTHGDNARDRMSKNRNSEHLRKGLRNGAYTCPEKRCRGEQNGASKLRKNQVQEIRKLYAQGTNSQRALAKTFGVAQSIIGAIVRREIWQHV